MQIKITETSFYTSQNGNNKDQRKKKKRTTDFEGGVGKREHSFFVLQTGAATGEISVENARKAQSKSIVRPSYSSPWTVYTTHSCPTMFIAALFIT